jgi:hypothetical protein
MATDLNRALFSGLDFDTYGDESRARLQVQFASVFNDFSVSSLGIMLLDLTSYGLSTLSFYLDRRATDTYLQTARTRKSVSRLTRQIGFKMGGAVASGVDLQIAVTEVQAFDVTVPEGYQIRGPSDLIFEVARDTLFTPAEQGAANPKVVPAFEGETITENFVSDGTPAQVFNLRNVPDGKFVVEGTVNVTVGGATWNVVDFLEFGATDQFEVGFSDEPPTIRFGDSVAGNIPTGGESIVVTYVASRGKDGQVPQGTIEDPVTPLVVAFTQIPITVTNPEASVGGDDPLSIAAAKALAPKVFKSRQVAVTGEDYEALAGSFADPLFGRVAVAKAISSRSAATDLTVQNLLTVIVNASTSLDATITSETATALAGLDQILLDTADIDTALGNIVTEVGNISAATASAIASAQTTKNRANEISTDASDIQTHVVDGKAAVAGSAASAPEQATINGFFDLISGEATAISGSSAAVTTSQNTVITQQAAIDTAVEAIGTSTAEAELLAIDTAKASINTQEGVIRTSVLAIQTDSTNLTSTISTNKALIEEHFDKILAADCKSNLVTVPILTRDAGGFYQAPSSGLLDALQAFLDARKEVTQTVSVTSGEDFLVPAVIVARVGVGTNFSESVIKTTVEAVIEGVLRDREFGSALYESDLDSAVLAVDGVTFTNVDINGHLDGDGVTLLTSRLDSDGNLIVDESEVITRGTITINTEAATT